jgi:hypothetical protein
MRRAALIFCCSAAGLAACCDAPGAAPAVVVLDANPAADAGFVAAFADYPVGHEAFMALDARRRALPPELQRAGSGFYLSGDNRSDDLFMYLRRRVDGLRPRARYRVGFMVEFATDSPAGCVGPGGAPGESVHVKAGATATEPRPEVSHAYGEPWYLLGLDKDSNGAEGGADAVRLGDVANTRSGCTEARWEMKTLQGGPTLVVTTDAAGRAWVFVGTDSGYESVTSLYYTRVRAVFTPID